MMTEHDDPTLDRLKHHFAQRVINQARQVLEVWQRLTRAEWNSDGMEELADATLRTNPRPVDGAAIAQLLENLQHHYGEERYRPGSLLRQKALMEKHHEQ